MKLGGTAFNLPFGCFFCLLYPATLQARALGLQQKGVIFISGIRKGEEEGRRSADAEIPLVVGRHFYLLPHTSFPDNLDKRGEQRSLSTRYEDLVQTIYIDHNENAYGHSLQTFSHTM